MTTEILRSMLYRGASLIQDVEFVIFDEVHYVNDQDRGVVWEEVIIMLPPHVTVIMLSATTPNNLEFAEWVGRTRNCQIYVISTLKRPVPLEHFLFTNRLMPKKKELYKIVDGGRVFNEQAYRQALQSLQSNKEREQAVTLNMPRGKQPQSNIVPAFRNVNQERNLWTDVVYYLQKNDLLPAVAFTFSKRKCDENAESLGNLDLNSTSEKSAVHIFMQGCLEKLNGTDSELPQIVWLQGLLTRGIAVHHSGLLPLMKEAVEILFSRGLVKILFATETFAMGVNMPARTVVFSSLRKHDGNGFRYLHAGEYTQMAGRAGRRGKDATGTVIILCPEGVLTDAILRQVILGQPTRLTSQFRLTYQMILSLLRIESLRVEEMLKRSFSEDGNQKSAPEQAAALEKDKKLLEGLEKLTCPICEVDLENYYATCRDIREKSKKIYKELLTGPQRLGNKILTVGSVLIVDFHFEGNSFSSIPAILFKREENSSNLVVGIPDIYFKTDNKTINKNLHFPPWYIEKVTVGEIAKCSGIKIVTISYENLIKITTCKLKIPSNCLTAGGGQINSKDISGILAEFSSLTSTSAFKEEEAKFPQFSSSAGGFEFDELVILRRKEFENLLKFTCHSCPDLFIHYTQIHGKKLLTDRLTALQFQLSEESLHLLPEYENRVKLLIELDYLDASHTVKIKGRVACEINTVDPLILTELLFENAFGDLNAAECAAFLSGLVFLEKSSLSTTGIPDPESGRETIEGLLQRLLLTDGHEEKEEEDHELVTIDSSSSADVDNQVITNDINSKLKRSKNWLINVTPGIEKTVKRLVSLTASLSALQRQNGLGHLPCGTARSYLTSIFNPALIRTVHLWASGKPFLNLTTEITSIPEGSIVRCITRLDETCREAAGAGKIMGDPNLVQKMEEAAKLIRRDICFASSLYL
jgi:antiviral helicase SKI2